MHPRERIPARFLAGVALAGCAGTVVGLIVGRFLGGDRSWSGAASPSSSATRRDPVALIPPALNDEHRLAELERRIDGIAQDVETLRSLLARDPVRGDAPVLPSPQEFRAQYQEVILGLVDQARRARVIDAKRDELSQVVDVCAEHDPVIAERTTELKEFANECVDRSAAIVLDLAPDGSQPQPGDPTYPQWNARWTEHYSWAQSEVARMLDPERADAFWKEIQGRCGGAFIDELQQRARDEVGFVNYGR